MNTTPTELSVESIEAVLVEKEAALAKEQAMLQGLKGLLTRMGFELVPIRTGRRQQGGRSVPGSPAGAGNTPGGARRGRPRKTDAASSGETQA